MDRAFSTFEVKKLDQNLRLIEGIASTPSTDRQGDVVEPMGAEFSLPLPFLWQHGKDPFVGMTPVGHLIAANPTAQGIPVRIQMERTDQPGRLKEILDFTWQSLQKQLVRGLSIGFQPIGNPEPIKGTMGLRFKKWRWLELSAVSIPANQDASISVIRSLALAQSGTRANGSSHTLPAVVGAQSKAQTMATALPIADQLQTVSAELKTKSSRLEELILRDGADGGLEDTEQTELGTVRTEVEKLSGRVKNLKALQEAQGAMATPLIVKAADGNTHAQPTYVPHVEVKGDNLAPGQEFARYVICRMAALKFGGSPMEYAKEYYKDNPRIQWLIKDNIPAGTATDNLFAKPLVNPNTLVSEFIEYLRPQTIIGRIPGLRRVPFNVRVTGQTSGGTGYWVGEGQSKPLTRFATSATTLTWAKVAAIIAITDELARFSSPSAELLVRDELVACLRERLDIDFVDPLKAAVAGVSPASITNGVTNLNDTGATLANTLTDVAQFFNAMLNNNIDISQCVWIMPNTVALQLSLMRDSLGSVVFPTISVNGGTWQGLPVVTSQYMLFGHTPANNKVILVSAPDIFLSDDGGFTVDISREASLEMDDQPVMASSSTAGSPSGPTGSALVSMFQTNSIAIRCERFINWAKRRTTAVVWMDDVRWAA